MLDRIKEAIALIKPALDAGVIPNAPAIRFHDFLQSFSRQVKAGKTPSAGQIRYLESIEKQCSKEAVEEALQWDYRDDLRELAVICAEYYENNSESYFESLRTRVLSDVEGHKLNKREFFRMCGNKFAHKIIEEHQQPARFEVGEMVQIRSSNRLDMSPKVSRDMYRKVYDLHRKAARHDKVLAMVIKVKPIAPFRATKGGKTYQILPIGWTMPLYCAEKDLKKPIKSK